MLTACGGAAATEAPVIPEAPKQTEPPAAADTPVLARPTSAPDCTDSAAFVNDVTVPDNTKIEPGKSFVKTWQVKNTGTCTWGPDYRLVFALGEKMGAPDSSPIAITAPAEDTVISVELTAPNQSASFRADFQLLNPAGEAIPIDNGKYLWVVISVGTTTAGSGGGTSTPSPPSISTGIPGLANVTCAYSTDAAKTVGLVTAINAYRAQKGLPAFTVNALLDRAAQSHSADMACNQLFVHTGSNGSTPQSRVAAVGYAASSVTENVYGRYPAPTGQETVTWWISDPSDPRHGQNLVSTKYTEIGVGYSFFNNFGYYAVVFAVP
jgi:uncharacterized protein YkwD